MLSKIFALSWAWAVLHPALIWFAVSFGINLAWKDASEYALTHPRFAAFKKLAQKWGLSPRDTFALIARLFVGSKLPPPGPSDFGNVDSGLNADDTQPVKVPSIPVGTSVMR